MQLTFEPEAFEGLAVYHPQAQAIEPHDEGRMTCVDEVIFVQ